jgi:hypothetical protein
VTQVDGSFAKKPCPRNLDRLASAPAAMITRRNLLAVALIFAVAHSLSAEVPAVIAKARAFYGQDVDLAAIQSIHYQGRLVSTETSGDGETLSVEAQVEIVFQKPYQQRIVASSPEKVEITALDDYEGWQRIEDPRNPATRRVGLLAKEQVKRLRANTWEQLSFFQGIESRGGTVVDHGLVDLDGRPAHKLAFVHDDDIIFTRYFAPADGQLLQTETEQGARIREDGELRAGGVRFPQRIVTSMPLADGGHRIVSVEFESVTVNESFAAEDFRVPFMGARLAQ